ncbi:hypothetical protein GCM10027448_10670 [Nocardioides dilutus]
MDPELVTGRQATALLAATGLARRHALRTLSAGLAGSPRQVPGAMLYERTAVEALVRRPCIDLADLDELCPQGAFVSRRLVDVRQDLSAQREQVAGHWRLNPFCAVALSLWANHGEPLAFVATVTGFVVLGAEILDTAVDDSGWRLVLGPPGDWFESLDGRRLVLGQGGEWTIRRRLAPRRPVRR